MENASKALIMAAGVLIGILVLSLAVYLFVSFGSTSADINKQRVEQQLVEFNSKFTSYEGKDGLTIYDVITLARYARENNEYYENDPNYTIQVKLDRELLHNKPDSELNRLLKDEQSAITQTNTNLPTYKCKVTNYHKDNGRVSEIVFSKN